MTQNVIAHRKYVNGVIVITYENGETKIIKKGETK